MKKEVCAYLDSPHFIGLKLRCAVMMDHANPTTELHRNYNTIYHSYSHYNTIYHSQSYSHSHTYVSINNTTETTGMHNWNILYICEHDIWQSSRSTCNFSTRLKIRNDEEKRLKRANPLKQMERSLPKINTLGYLIEVIQRQHILWIWV